MRKPDAAKITVAFVGPNGDAELSVQPSELSDTATNGLVQAVRDRNAIVAFENFNDLQDLCFATVVIFLAPHFCDCLVEVLNHNSIARFVYHRLVLAVRLLLVRLNLVFGIRARFRS